MPVRAPRPETRTDLAQIAKTVLATVAAWWVADDVVGLEQSFLASWVALLTVQATVHRTFWRGAQSVLATALGIVLSYLAVLVLGTNALALGAAVLAGLLLARTPLIRHEGVAVATTAVFVITTGVGDHEMLLAHRLGDTVIGVLVGLVVNVAIRPPLDDRAAVHRLEQAAAALGALLHRIAEECAERREPPTRSWIEETRRIDRLLDVAGEEIDFARESQWANLRRRHGGRTLDVAATQDRLVRLEEGVAHARSIARVVDGGAVDVDEWDEDFRRRWSDLTERLGTRLADPDGEVASLRSEVDRLAADLSGDDLPTVHWPVYGALLTALRVIAVVVDDVASRPLAPATRTT